MLECSTGLPQGKRPWKLSRFHCYRCILHNFATPLQGSYRTSQVVFQVFPDLLLCVFHNFPWPCTACKSTSFITQSTLPSQHTVREHCTNYYIILHLTYLLYPMQIRCKCQNSSLSSNRSEIKKFAFPGLLKICTNSVLGYRLQRHWDRRDKTWLNRQLVVLLCGVVVDSRTSANRSCVKLILVDFHTINTHIWSVLLQNTISLSLSLSSSVRPSLSPGYLGGGGCHASHQLSDASTRAKYHLCCSKYINIFRFSFATQFLCVCFLRQ